MTNLILWIVLAVAYFTQTFPPLRLSERKAAQVVDIVLSGAIGACTGLGLALALRAVLGC